ncbi:MAG: hypothetical protein IIY71_03580, partial [Oscillospiraceae bacterium]|nr:hypothetical protein [Oscillospiraceae bacterium]
PLLSLLTNAGIWGVGIDTVSIDPVDTADDPNHHILLEHGCVIVENLTHLDQLPAACPFCALPLLYPGQTVRRCGPLLFLEENT